MKKIQKLCIGLAVLGLLAAAGCKPPLDLSMQRNRIFLMGRLLVGQTCDVRVIWRQAPEALAPVTVTADLSEIGGQAEQELLATDNGTWRWIGQVNPENPGEKLITITAAVEQGPMKEVAKKFRVFKTEKAIALASTTHGSLALKADGTVVEWSFEDGKLLETPEGLRNVTAIAKSNDYSVALKDNGTVVVWSCDALSCPQELPVPDGLADVVAVAAGYHHFLALKADGNLVGWGFMNEEPMHVPAAISDVVSIGAGEGRCAAVKADGTIAKWPHSYMTPVNDAVSISLGSNFDVAVQSDGNVVQRHINYISGWRDVPLPIRAGRLRATAAASGDSNNIALKQDGSIVVWGYYQWYGGVHSGVLVFHHEFNNIIAVNAFDAGEDDNHGFLEYSNSEFIDGYSALAEDGSVIAWKEQWSTDNVTLLPVPAALM